MIRSIKVITNFLIVLIIVAAVWWFVFKKGGEIVVNSTIPAIVDRLHTVNRLETAQINISKIIEGEKELSDTIPGTTLDDTIAQFLFEDTIRMEVYGTVIAGFELGDLSSDSISIQENGISIVLPAPIILYTIVDDKTNVYDRERGLLTKGDPQMESIVREEARKIMREAALEGGLLDKAEQGASEALSSLLGSQIPIKISYYQ